MRIQISTYLAFLAIVFVAFGCKKLEPPVVPEDEPDFAVQFLVDGQGTSFVAGVNDYYMFSDFEKTSNNLHAFTGELRNINCESNCANSLKIKIYDFELAPESDINITESIALDTDYDFVTGEIEEDTTYIMLFTPDLPDEATGDYEYIWTIDSEIFTQETVQVDSETPFFVDACLELVDASELCNGSTCREVEFNQFFDGECFANLIISDTLVGLDSVQLSVITSDGLPVNDITWSTGETTDTIGVSTLGTFSFMGNSSSCPISGVGQLNGDLTEVGSAFFCTPDFEIQFEREITLETEIALGRVIIEYIDENGVFYSTTNANVSGFSNFRVISLTNYDRNERDQATVLLEIEFSTVVFSEGGVSLEILEGRGTIGMAYPD